jgi:hypothetical protein
MSVSFENLVPSNTYSRPQLADLWGYSGPHALTRSIITPRDDNKIILFVTLEKLRHMGQSTARLIGGTLIWEGPADHFAEDRMIQAKSTGDQIHVFWRSGQHSAFVYQGQFVVVNYTLNTDKPSTFVLKHL